LPKGVPKNTDEKPEVYKPMATQEPTTEEKIKALETRVKELEGLVLQHRRYHFGKQA
jgi:hypothetical protein